MADFPPYQVENLGGACISTFGYPFLTGLQIEGCGQAGALALASGAQLAVYVPFVIDQPKTAKQMFWENGASPTGTTDVGIYDSLGNRLVNLGATTNTSVSLVQTGTITSTLLVPGLYYAALLPSTNVTQQYWSGIPPVTNLRSCGCQQQAVGASTLPSTATFAVVGFAFLPMIGISFQATM